MTDPRCGTYKGYTAHRRNRTTPCGPCKTANSRYSTEKRSQRRKRQREHRRTTPPPPPPPTPVARATTLPDWMDDALCAQTGPMDFTYFPGKGGSTATAKRVCAGCPVVAQCLAYGLDEPHGVWGGLSEKERRRVRRRTA